MRAQLRSELIKILTIRTVTALLLVAAALALLGVVLEGRAATLAELATDDTQRTLIGDFGASNAVLLATFAGLLLVTTEFRYGTIRPTLLFEPRRRVVLAAKLAAAALVGAVFGVVCVVLSFGAGLTVLTARDTDYALTGAQTVVLVFGPIAAGALTAMMGVSIGALIRNQVGAIVVLALYSVGVEALVFATAPSIGAYLPGQAASALGGMPDAHLLAPGLAALVAVAWTIAFVASATVRTEHGDV